MVLGRVPLCRASSRGVLEFGRELLGTQLSLGTVPHLLPTAIEPARPSHLGQQLGPVAIAGLDETYPNGQPVPSGAEIASPQGFLLRQAEHADGDTWGVRLLEAQQRGLAPQALVADFGTGSRAGQHLAYPGLPSRGDVFPAPAESTKAVTFREERAYDLRDRHAPLRQKKAPRQRQARRDQHRQVQSRAARCRWLALPPQRWRWPMTWPC